MGRRGYTCSGQTESGRAAGAGQAAGWRKTKTKKGEAHIESDTPGYPRDMHAL